MQLFIFITSSVHAEVAGERKKADWFFSNAVAEQENRIQISRISDYQFSPLTQEQTFAKSTAFVANQISLINAVQQAITTHPDIQQQVSSLAAQNENINVAQAAYFPQLSGGISTGDMTTGERGRQLISLNATQMLYDFGKVKTSVDIQQTRLWAEQAQLLISIDDVALRTSSAIINIKRSQEMVRIAERQINGIQKIVEITQLRAQAGVSSQADPVQAKSYLQAAQTNLLAQQSLLNQYQLQLRSLIGINLGEKQWDIPNFLIAKSSLYDEPNFKQIPKMMHASAEIQTAQAQKTQTKLSRYPTLNVKGSLNQAVNGRNPNNNEDNGLYSSIMLEANSNFFQGGAIAAQARSASYAEQAAKAKLNSVYLDVLDQVRLNREQVESKQNQMKILQARQMTTIKTKELYQEQYKLGTRTALDLLNAEQAIHAVASDLESTRYDIYSSLVQFIAATGKSREVYALDHLNIHGVMIQP
ncbi:TolC family protein [Acinetobacter johnsonii]|uniref:TolC family protein n=1 Tax=Acinetobacter johnsonii TaxID=40214 RepID=UPI001E50BE4E|nr:TolC family protein [Acinetobacter johnsonii]